MEKKKKKDYYNVSMRIDKEVWDQLREYADTMGQSYTVATERILDAFLKKNNVPKEFSSDPFN